MKSELLVLFERHDVYGKFPICSISPLLRNSLCVAYNGKRRMQIISRWTPSEAFWLMQAKKSCAVPKLAYAH